MDGLAIDLSSNPPNSTPTPRAQVREHQGEINLPNLTFSDPDWAGGAEEDQSWIRDRELEQEFVQTV